MHYNFKYMDVPRKNTPKKRNPVLGFLKLSAEIGLTACALLMIYNHTYHKATGDQSSLLSAPPTFVSFEQQQAALQNSPEAQAEINEIAQNFVKTGDAETFKQESEELGRQFAAGEFY